MKSPRFFAKVLVVLLAATIFGGVLDATLMAASNDVRRTLQQDMRKLWSDHVFWTRVYIISALAESPDKQQAAQRLLKNQEDIGNAMASYYGKAAGDKVTALLKDHILIAVEIIDAAKKDKKAKFNQENQKWQKNADEIAAALASLNPNWPQAQLKDAMKQHLDTTANELKARLEKRWADDVKAFDEVYNHILHMSDMLSDGIMAQFPDKFPAP